MRVAFTITDDSGKVFQGRADLNPIPTQRSARKKTGGARLQSSSAPTVNFYSPARAFVKNHARGMSGPQKFTLLLAHMTKGDRKVEARLNMIEKQWKKMTALLGKWNRAPPTRAKEHEWVDSPKNGTYVLLPGWRGIFNA
jgi:hypothetical protein